MPISRLSRPVSQLLRRQPQRVLIVGTGKSGTTALFFRIKKSMPAGTEGLFEPQSREPVVTALANEGPLVAKMLIPLPGDLLPELDGWFSHRVLIMRDLRDVIVSAVLYTSAYTHCWNHSEERIQECIQLLKAKESGTLTIPVVSLLENFWTDFKPDAFAVIVRTIETQLYRLTASPHDYFLLNYEHMIEGRLEALEAYLGFPLTQDDSVGPEFTRVVRSKGAGEWRDWFTADDVAYFRPLFEGIMVHFGYDPDDWRINAGVRLSPEHGSDYFLRVVNERRRGALLSEIDPANAGFSVFSPTDNGEVFRQQ